LPHLRSVSSFAIGPKLNEIQCIVDRSGVLARLYSCRCSLLAAIPKRLFKSCEGTILLPVRFLQVGWSNLLVVIIHMVAGMLVCANCSNSIRATTLLCRIGGKIEGAIDYFCQELGTQTLSDQGCDGIFWSNSCAKIEGSRVHLKFWSSWCAKWRNLACAKICR
jgi:hypothetical protein